MRRNLILFALLGALLLGALLLGALLLGALLPGAALPARAQEPPTAAQTLYALLAAPRPQQSGWQRETAAAYRALGSEPAAQAHLSAAAALENDAALWQTLAAGFTARGEWLAAQEALAALIALNPDNAAAHYRLGVLLAPFDPAQADPYLQQAAENARFRAPAQQLRETISAYRAESPAYYSAQIGVTLAALEQWPQAEQAFELAVALAPDYGEAWAYLAFTRASQSKDGRAAAENALTLAAENPLALYLAGLAFRSAGDLAQAEALLLLAYDLDPANPAFAAELGALYRAAGEMSLAESWLREAARLAPGDADFLKLLALFYAEERFNLDGSGLTTLHEALALLPDDPDLLAGYAWALYSLGDTAAALETINRALLNGPETPRALYYDALLQESTGQRAAAIDRYRQLAGDPQAGGFAERARRALDRLGVE